MGTCGIYRWFNTVTGKSYVGSSVNIEGRRYEHLYLLRRGKSHSLRLQNAYLKYGEASFAFEVLEVCAKERLEEAETRWCLALDSVENGYNCSFCVRAPTRGYKHTLETRSRMSAAQRAVVRTPEVRAMAGAQLRAYNLSLRGKPKTPEHRAAIGAARSGIRHTEEARAKMRGRVISEAQRQAQRERPVSEATRQKMSANNWWKGKTGAAHNRSVPIVQWAMDGTRLAEFPAVSEASRQLGIGRESIKNCLRGYAKSAGGFRWTYA